MITTVVFEFRQGIYVIDAESYVVGHLMDGLDAHPPRVPDEVAEDE